VRVYSEIDRVRKEKGGADLRDQLLWRVEILGDDVDITTARNRDAFSEVLDAYVPENHRLVFNPSQPCRASLAGGGEIVFTGLLVTGDTATAELERRIFLGRRVAEHRRFRVAPRFRGNRIAPRSLIRSMALYDQLGTEHVLLRAAWSGTWYWAQWGFHFGNPEELAKVQAHAQELIDIFGGGLDAFTLTHPSQFYRLGEPVRITFDQLGDALPHRRDAYEEIAYDNGIGLHDPCPFGRMVLLTGPSWDACLDTSGADRLIFDDRARRTLGAEGAAS
jgi:hypothetical protein